MVTRINNDLRKQNDGRNHLAKAGTDKIRLGMRNLFVKDAIKSHKPLSNSHKDASREDLIAIILLCLWTVDIKLAQFAFFLGSLYQLSGRVAEASVVPFKNVTMYQPDEFRGPSPTETDKIAKVFLWRTKTTSNQDLSIFNDRDSFIIDWYFLMAYSMLMAEETSDQLFPDFAQKGKKSMEYEARDGDDGEENPQATRQSLRSRKKKTRESVSRYFQETFNKVIKIYDVLRGKFDRYQEQERPRPVRSSFVLDSYVKLNEQVTAHSPKRCAVNTALEDPILSTILICLRAGWIMKAVHTVFDYVGYNKNHDRKVARSLAMWRVGSSDDGHNGAGRPPSIKALKSRPGDFQKAEHVMNCLFVDYESIEGANNKDLQDVLFATVLKDLENYLALLKEHPDTVFGETDEECFKNHRFLQKLLQSAINAGLDNPMETLLEWGRLIDMDFHRRNFMFVTKESMRRVLPPDELGSTFEADPRSFYEFFDCTSRAMDQLHRDSLLHKAELDDLKKMRQEEIDLRKQEIQNQAIIIQQQNEIIHLLKGLGRESQGVTPINVNAIGTVPAAIQKTQTVVALPGLANLTITSIFKSWHRQGYYKLPIQSNTKKDKNARFVIKTAIEYFNLFLDTHIDALPEDVDPGVPSPGRTRWIEQLDEKTEKAWVEVQDLQTRYLEKNPTVKKINLERVTAFKKFMDAIPHEKWWPVGPPGESYFQPTYMGKMKTRNQLAQQQMRRREKNEKDQNEEDDE
jgi:hypothetical protein